MAATFQVGQDLLMRIHFLIVDDSEPTCASLRTPRSPTLVILAMS